MSNGADPKQVLERYLDALVAADIDTIRDSFAQDATWTVKADLPIAGPDGRMLRVIAGFEPVLLYPGAMPSVDSGGSGPVRHLLI